MKFPSRADSLLLLPYCLEVRELNYLINMHIASREMQIVTGSAVAREPVATVNLHSQMFGVRHGELEEVFPIEH